MCAKATKATPEQLQEAIASLTRSKGQTIDNDTRILVPVALTEILALFATFLASIELPVRLTEESFEELKAKYPELDKTDFYHHALEESQAIIDKLIKELQE